MVDQKEPFCYNSYIMWFLGNKFIERQNMNQKLRAAGITAGMLAICVVIGLAMKLVFTYITPEMVPFILTAIGLTIVIYTMYSVILMQIQYRDQLKSMVDRK